MTDILLILATGCFIIVHGPNGKDELHVDASSIFIVRPTTKDIEPHIAAGTKTILYIGGQKFGISETPEEVEAMIRDCDK